MQVVSGDGWWKAVSLDAAANSGGSSDENGSAAAPLLEFVLTDGFDSWDKAPEGGNYKIQEGGVWQLADGLLAQPERPPVLLVSDLDDTMIGDDAATAAFTRWWQEEAVPAGGRLVFNTGRVSRLGERQEQGCTLWRARCRAGAHPCCCPLPGCAQPPPCCPPRQALDLFQALLVEKGDVLAQPDMLISAIGTRIYAK